MTGDVRAAAGALLADLDAQTIDWDPNDRWQASTAGLIETLRAALSLPEGMVTVPDELRELSDKALPTLGELQTDRSFMDGSLSIKCTGTSFMRATELAEAEAEFIVAAVNFVREALAPSPSSALNRGGE